MAVGSERGGSTDLHPPRRASTRSLDDEGGLEVHGPGHVVEVGRGRHHCLVNLGKLLFVAAALDPDDVAQLLVAWWHGGIDPEEAAEVNVTVGLDLQLFQDNP